MLVEYPVFIYESYEGNSNPKLNLNLDYLAIFLSEEKKKTNLLKPLEVSIKSKLNPGKTNFNLFLKAREYQDQTYVISKLHTAM